jgi:Predicted hydrolases or acyltransferases (alpha/beta hydrolase superfamily)
MERILKAHCGSGLRPLALSTLMLAAASISAQGQSESTPPPLPPPGQLIDLGGWRLHLNCTGTAKTGQPAVILEAGSGDFSVDWSLVQPGVARFARVCSYDRAGSGWSDLGPRPRTLHQKVWELHTLLEKGGMKPPYMLVGHSYGGWIVRQYASTYPDEVAGMALVESGADNPQRISPDGKLVRAADLVKGQAIPPVKTSGPLRESEIPPRFVTIIQAQIKDAAPHANDPPRDKLPADAQRMRTWTISQVKHGISNDNPVEAEELTALYLERKSKEHPLGNMPLIVLSRGVREDAAAAEEEHAKDQAVLVTLSTAGKQIIAKRSGHHIPIDEPDVVVTAVRDVMAAIRR